MEVSQSLATALEKRKVKEQTLFNLALLRNMIVLQLGIGLATFLVNYLGDDPDSTMLTNFLLSVALVVTCVILRVLAIWWKPILGYTDIVLMICTFVVFVEVNYYLAPPTCSQGSLRSGSGDNGVDMR